MDHRAEPRVTRDALRRYFPDGSYGSRLRPLPEYGCIYVRNAKAGVSTITLWLHRIHTGAHGWTPERNIHKTHQLPRPKDVGWDTVARMLDGEAFRFTFVRDPIRRVESGYRDKIVRARRDRWRAEVRQTIGLPEVPEEPVTFDQFVAALEAQDPIRMDSHFRPQHLNLMHGLVEYDLVGHLETFDRDLALIREATGMPDAPIEVRNQAATMPKDSLFDGRPGLLRRVRDIYARDFELYGY